MNRRRFLTGTAAAASLATTRRSAAAVGGKPAALGGEPLRKLQFPSWPVFDQVEDRAVLDVLHSGKWGRGNGNTVARFEEAYAKLLGAKGCLATANGTSALLTAVNALDIGPGDEVI